MSSLRRPFSRLLGGSCSSSVRRLGAGWAPCARFSSALPCTTPGWRPGLAQRGASTDAGAPSRPGASFPTKPGNPFDTWMEEKRSNGTTLEEYALETPFVALPRTDNPLGKEVSESQLAFFHLTQGRVRFLKACSESVDSHRAAHVLLTAPNGSGKSGTAYALASFLRSQGHQVFYIAAFEFANTCFAKRHSDPVTRLLGELALSQHVVDDRFWPLASGAPMAPTVVVVDEMARLAREVLQEKEDPEETRVLRSVFRQLGPSSPWTLRRGPRISVFQFDSPPSLRYFEDSSLGWRSGQTLWYHWRMLEQFSGMPLYDAAGQDVRALREELGSQLGKLRAQREEGTLSPELGAALDTLELQFADGLPEHDRPESTHSLPRVWLASDSKWEAQASAKKEELQKWLEDEREDAPVHPHRAVRQPVGRTARYHVLAELYARAGPQADDADDEGSASTETQPTAAANGRQAETFSVLSWYYKRLFEMGQTTSDDPASAKPIYVSAVHDLLVGNPGHLISSLKEPSLKGDAKGRLFELMAKQRIKNGSEPSSEFAFYTQESRREAPPPQEDDGRMWYLPVNQISPIDIVSVTIGTDGTVLVNLCDFFCTTPSVPRQAWLKSSSVQKHLLKADKLEAFCDHLAYLLTAVLRKDVATKEWKAQAVAVGLSKDRKKVVATLVNDKRAPALRDPDAPGDKTQTWEFKVSAVCEVLVLPADYRDEAVRELKANTSDHGVWLCRPLAIDDVAKWNLGNQGYSK